MYRKMDPNYTDSLWLRFNKTNFSLGFSARNLKQKYELMESRDLYYIFSNINRNTGKQFLELQNRFNLDMKELLLCESHTAETCLSLRFSVNGAVHVSLSLLEWQIYFRT